MHYTLDDILGVICLGIMMVGLPWALPVLHMLVTQ